MSAADSTDAHSTDADSTDAESTDVDSTDADSTDADSTDADSTDAESTDAESTDADSTDADSTDADSTDAHSTDAHSTDAHSTDVDSTDADSTDADSTDAESTDADSTDAESTDAESRPVRAMREKTMDTVVEEMYWVLAESEARGPYAMAAMLELARRGALTSETLVRIDGEEEWRPAGEVPGLGGFVPRVMKPVQAAPARRVPRWVLGVGIGLLAGGLVGAAALVLPGMVGGSGVVPEAVLTEGMPSRVRSMIVFRQPEESEVERELTSSGLAAFCGGENIGDRLLGAQGLEPAELELRGVLGVLQRDGVREGLECGQRLSRASSDLEMVVIEFEEADETRMVAVMTLGELSDPPFPRRHSFSGLEGRCHPAEESSTDCAENEHALVRRGDQWAFGDAKSVAAYAREWNRGAERSETTHMEYARLLARAVAGDSTYVLVRPRPEALPFNVMCSAVPGGVEACLPDVVGDSIRRLLSQSRGVSVETREPKSGGELDPKLRWVMTLAARDEEDARDIARELEALLQDWRAHLENNESAYVERIREAEERDADRDEAMLRGFLRAVARAEVEVDGRLARLVAEAELSDAEQREVRAYLETVREDREAAARIVTATRAGEAPARADLARLVGDEAAGWMLEPRATKASCERIREHRSELASGGVPTADFGANFRLEQRFTDARCIGMVMPAPTLSCLTEASSIAEMDRCAIPRAPWRRQAFEREEAGELSDDDERLPRMHTPYDQHTVELEAGWIIRAELETVAFEPLLWLMAPGGGDPIFAERTDGVLRLEHTAASEGTYTIGVGSFQRGARGPYTLRLSARPGLL